MADKLKNREFGILVSLALALMALYDVVQLPVVVGVLLGTLLLPKLFTPFTRLWLRLGMGLNFVFGNLILVLIFYLVVTPVGLWRRMLGIDAMFLRRFKGSADSIFSVCNKEYERSHLKKQY